MATLIVGGVTVPVASDGAQEKPTFIGDRARMQDASMRVLVIATKREWTVTTNIMDVGSAATLIAQLESATLPLACSGDLLAGSVNCFPELTSNAPVNVHGTLKRRLTFTLYEA